MLTYQSTIVIHLTLGLYTILRNIHNIVYSVCGLGLILGLGYIYAGCPKKMGSKF